MASPQELPALTFVKGLGRGDNSEGLTLCKASLPSHSLNGEQPPSTTQPHTPAWSPKPASLSTCTESFMRNVVMYHCRLVETYLPTSLFSSLRIYPQQKGKQDKSRKTTSNPFIQERKMLLLKLTITPAQLVEPACNQGPGGARNGKIYSLQAPST